MLVLITGVGVVRKVVAVMRNKMPVEMERARGDWLRSEQRGSRCKVPFSRSI